MTPWRIVCDVGGTNIRIARADTERQIIDTIVRPTRECTSLAAFLRDYADRVGSTDSLEGVAIAAAGPVEDGGVALTNRPLVISAADVSAAFGDRTVRLLNDLEAVAWSLPSLQPEQVSSVRAPDAPLSGPRLVVNVGTGFGAALLVATGKSWQSVACEPGHMKLAGALAAADGTLLADGSIEDTISGLALARAETVARLGTDATAAPGTIYSRHAFNRNFSALLGQICGDLVLACGAWGGVYFCGSVAAEWLRQPDLPAFLAAFEAKGPMAPRMARVRISQILAPHPALIGLAALPFD